MSRARRGRHEGSVYERKDGRWAVVSSEGFDRQTGKRKRKTIYAKTKAEALALLRGEQSDRNARKPGSDVRLGPYLDYWLTQVKAARRPKTYELYAGVVKLHLTALRDVALHDLTPRLIAAHLDALPAAGRLKQIVRTVLRVALKDAVPDLLTRNPVDSVKRPGATKRTFRILTPAEAKRFLRACAKEINGALFIVALATGLRIGELLGLRRENVYLKERFLMVQRQYIDAGGKRSLDDLKTDRSRRRVDLPVFAVQALRVTLNKASLDSGFVFVGATGAPLQRKVVRATLKRILNAAGLPPMRLHDLRHSQASLLLVAGVHPQIVSERLGHASVAFTLRTYSHALPTLQREAARSIDRMLTRRRPKSRR
jgi:integrase